MNAKTIVIAIVALVVAGATGLLIQNWMSAQRNAMLRAMPKSARIDTGAPKVMVARKSLPAGTFLKPEHVEWRAWPKNGIAKVYLVKGKRDAALLLFGFASAMMPRPSSSPSSRLSSPAPPVC